MLKETLRLSILILLKTYQAIYYRRHWSLFGWCWMWPNYWQGSNSKSSLQSNLILTMLYIQKYTATRIFYKRFWSKLIFLKKYSQVNCVFNLKSYNVIPCMESFWSHDYFGKFVCSRLMNIFFTQFWAVLRMIIVATQMQRL